MTGHLHDPAVGAPGCKTPRPKKRLLNTMWSCPSCGRAWVLRVVQYGLDPTREWIAVAALRMPIVYYDGKTREPDFGRLPVPADERPRRVPDDSYVRSV